MASYALRIMGMETNPLGGRCCARRNAGPGQRDSRCFLDHCEHQLAGSSSGDVIRNKSKNVIKLKMKHDRLDSGSHIPVGDPWRAWRHLKLKLHERGANREMIGPFTIQPFVRPQIEQRPGWLTTPSHQLLGAVCEACRRFLPPLSCKISLRLCCSRPWLLCALCPRTHIIPPFPPSHLYNRPRSPHLYHQARASAPYLSRLRTLA